MIELRIVENEMGMKPDIQYRYHIFTTDASGSQNVNTELLVDGFNHCLQKMKGMLR